MRRDDLYRVYLMPGARADLKELRAFIAQRNSRRVARNYLLRLKKFYEGLALAPFRGERRVNNGFEMRVIGFERRVRVVFVVLEESRVVEIVGFHYGGRSA